MIKLGAQLFSLRHYTKTAEDLLATMKKVKEIGYENVQLSGAGPIPAEQIRDICKETGLEIVCTHSAWDRIVNDTDALIADHKTFGCNVIGLGAMPKEFRGSAQGLENLIAALAEPVKKIEAAGMHFAYHNHAFEFEKLSDADGIMYDMMLERCPNWHFIMDTYWVSFGGGCPIDYITKIGTERLVNIHFKDMAKDEARSICACGNGVLDFAKIYETCKQIGVKNILVEQDNADDQGNAFGEMETSFRHLRPIIK